VVGSWWKDGSRELTGLAKASAVPVVSVVESPGANTDAPGITVPDVEIDSEVRATTRLAIYPLLPAPDSINDPQLSFRLGSVHHKLNALFGSNNDVIVLDRQYQAKLDSPERAALASQEIADYILTGGLRQQAETTHLRLQVSHRESRRLVATLNYQTTDVATDGFESALEHVLIAIERDKRKQSQPDQNNRLRISVAGFIPSHLTTGEGDTLRALQNRLVDDLLLSDELSLISNEYAYGLYLESGLAPDTVKPQLPQMILHGNLLATNTESDGYHVVLHMQRIGGLRKTLVVHSDNSESLPDKVIASVRQHLETPVYATNSRQQQADLLMQSAWKLIFKSGKPFVNGFSYKITDRNRVKLKEFQRLARQALDIDNNNYEARGALALSYGLQGNGNLEYELIEPLLWDWREPAFAFGKQILDKRLNINGTQFSSAQVAGTSGTLSEEDLAGKLADAGWLKLSGYKNEVPEYFWRSAKDALRFVPDDPDIWEYLLGIKGTSLDNLIRYRAVSATGVLPTGHPERKTFSNVGVGPVQSVYYALANSAAPISLSLGKNGFYSAPVVIELDKSVYAESYYRYLQLIGMATIADGDSVEPDLLYASVICGYNSLFCPYSKSVFDSVERNSDSLLNAYSKNSFDKTKGTLIADSLLAMAKRESALLSQSSGNKQLDVPASDISLVNVAEKIESSVTGPSIGTGTNSTALHKLKQLYVPTEHSAGPAFEYCADCPDYLKKRRIASSPDGRWQVVPEAHYDGAGTFDAEKEIVVWMFKNELLDIRGKKTRRHLRDDRILSKLRQDFPDLSDNDIEKLIRDYFKAEFKQHGSGRVVVYGSAGQNPQFLTPPKARPEQEFGDRVYTGNGKILVCDQWGEGFEYLLYNGDWLFDRNVKGVCNNPVMAISGDRIIRAKNHELQFLRQSGNSYTVEKAENIGIDFKQSSVARIAISDIWTNDSSLVVATITSGKRRFFVYRNIKNKWQANTVIHLPEHYDRLVFHDDQMFQTTATSVIGYRLSVDGMAYESHYGMPEGYRGGTGFIFVMDNGDSVKLVLSGIRSPLEMLIDNDGSGFTAGTGY